MSEPVDNKPASSFTDLKGDDDGAGAEKDEAKAALEKQLQDEKDRRVEERFVWIVVCVILVDVLWFRNAINPVVPIVVLLLEAVILFIMAKRMGIEEVSLLFERLMQSISRTPG
jgi:hypothetical protein